MGPGEEGKQGGADVTHEVPPGSRGFGHVIASLPASSSCSGVTALVFRLKQGHLRGPLGLPDAGGFFFFFFWMLFLNLSEPWFL